MVRFFKSVDLSPRARGLLFVAAVAALGIFFVSLFPNATGWKRETPDAVRLVHQDQVPHIDNTGAPRTTFNADLSFFPIGLYHALTGPHFGRTYDLSTVAQAGFNTIHAWEGQPIASVVDAARRATLKVLLHNPTDDDVAALADDRSVLAWYLDEEPTEHYSPDETDKRLDEFRARRDRIRAIDPTRPVFALDGPPRPKRLDDWRKWAAVGDVSAHFFYPVVAETPLSSLDHPRSIPETVGRAVTETKGEKPVWFLVQAFSGPRFGWAMPEPRHLRAMVYAAVIHGATGVLYFGYDSFVMRDGDVLGMAPDPVAMPGDAPDFDNSGTPPLVASEKDLAASRGLWAEAKRLNAELRALTPALLSPTVDPGIRVYVSGRSQSATPIRLLVKRTDDGFVVLAVNLDDADLTLDVRVPGTVDRLETPHHAAPELKATAEGWRDRLAPFATRAYTFKLSEGGRPGQ